MDIRRLHRLIQKSAFTLAETVISLVIISAAALVLMTSVIMSAELTARTSDIRNAVDSVAEQLYKGESDSILTVPPVKIITGDSYKFEDNIDIPEIEIYCTETPAGSFYYYAGGMI